MAEEREVNVMSVELAIQRELAYRKKVASFLSEEAIADLIPLKAPPETINRDQASQMELDGWKLVRIEEEKQGTPYPTSDNDQAPLLALKGPKLGTQAKGEGTPAFKTNQASRMALEGPKVGMHMERGEGAPSSTNKSNQAARKALESSKLQMRGKKEERVPPSNTLRNPDPRSTHFVGKSSMSLSKPGSRPYTISSRTVAAGHEVPISVPNPKPSPVPTENQKASYPGPSVYHVSTHSEIARKATTSSPSCLPMPLPNSYVVGNGPGIFCHICKLDCSNPFNYKQHLRGHKHRAKLQYKRLSRNAADGKKEKQHPRCDMCEIWCTDENSLQFHFNGRKHKAKLLDVQLGQKRKAPQQHWCDLCPVPCPNAETYKQHLKGTNHATLLSSLGERRDI